MANAALPNQFHIGIAGLDSSGRRLVHALWEKRLTTVAYEPNVENIKALQEEVPGISIHITDSVNQFMGLLRPFRTIVMSGPDAGSSSCGEVLEQLEAGDLLIDAGNGYFKDCARRARFLTERNIRYMGMGIIGGRDPVVLACGRREVFQNTLPFLESIASTQNGEWSVSYLGSAVAAGHFVKMIHDGIEYSLAQLSKETSDLLKRALVMDDEELHEVTQAWQMIAPGSARADAARWASQTAHELGTLTPTIDAAVGMRTLSELEKQNDFATTLFRQPLGHFSDDREGILDELHGALHVATIITYAEAIAVLATGSDRYGFEFDVPEVIRLSKGCDGIRGALLEEMATAIQTTPHLPNLLYDDDLSEKVMEQQERLRHAVWRAGRLQMAVPALMASLDYLDSDRGVWLPGNLIQASPTPPRLAGLGRR